VEDCRRFIRSEWALRAADAGWDMISLFGGPAVRPVDHLVGAGLLWRLCGGQIIRLYKDSAVIEVNGVERMAHRRPAPANFVLPWRLR
jgi:hypothetical protein